MISQMPYLGTDYCANVLAVRAGRVTAGGAGGRAGAPRRVLVLAATNCPWCMNATPFALACRVPSSSVLSNFKLPSHWLVLS